MALKNAGSIKGSRVISATEAARSFSELLDRVGYRGETFARACLLGCGRGYDKASAYCPRSRHRNADRSQRTDRLRARPARFRSLFPKIPGLTLLRWYLSAICDWDSWPECLPVTAV